MTELQFEAEKDLTPLCGDCGEHAEPWPFACPECGQVHHARCWRIRGGCAECDCRTHEPRPEAATGGRRGSARLLWSYLRLVAHLQQKWGIPMGPTGLAVILLAACSALLVALLWALL